MNTDQLLEFYRGKFQHFSELWNKTSNERYLNEALNYQAEIERLEKKNAAASTADQANG